MAHCSVIGALFCTVIVPFTSPFVTKTHGISSSLTKKQHTKHLLKFNQIHRFCAPVGPKLLFYYINKVDFKKRKKCDIIHKHKNWHFELCA